MPGFTPEASGPVASVSVEAPVGAVQVTDQAAMVVTLTTSALLLADQAASVAFHQPGMIVTDQSVAIAILKPSGSRRQYYLM